MYIKSELAEEIRQGALRSHDRLPSERALSERFGVSRATARQTLIQLEIGILSLIKLQVIMMLTVAL